MRTVGICTIAGPFCRLRGLSIETRVIGVCVLYIHLTTIKARDETCISIKQYIPLRRHAPVYPLAHFRLQTALEVKTHIQFHCTYSVA